MTKTYAISRVVDVCLVLPRRTLEFEFEDTPEERKKDYMYLLDEYPDCHVYQESIEC